MPPDSPEVIALREQIAFLKVIIYAETGGLVAVCGFFVAWVRTLYDARLSANDEESQRRDALLERVLDGLATLAAVIKLQRPGGGA